MTQASDDKIIILTGGFQDEAEAQGSTTTVDINQLHAHEEEANKRMIFTLFPQ